MRLGETQVGDQLGYNPISRGITSHTGTFTSTATATITLTVSVTSHSSPITSTSTRTATYGRPTTSHTGTITSRASQTVSFGKVLTSHSDPITSWVRNDRTSLELLDYDVTWDDDVRVWRTDWFQMTQILGNEDRYSLLPAITSDAAVPTADVHVEYDATGDGSPDRVSDPISVDPDEDVTTVEGMPIDENGYYRLVIQSYGGYNSLHSLDVAFTR